MWVAEGGGGAGEAVGGEWRKREKGALVDTGRGGGGGGREEE